MAAHAGEGGLRRLAHHVAELAGDRQLAGARHRGGLDEQDLAADRGPGEAGRDPGSLVRRCSAKKRRRPSSSRAASAETLTLPVALPSATSRAILRQTVPISRSRLRTPASRVYSSMIAERGVGERDPRGLQPVRLDLAGHQVALGDVELLVTV